MPNGKAKEVLAGYRVCDHGMGTKLAEYAETGPYHCEDCHFLKGRNKGEDNIFRDEDGRGRCDEKHMLKDKQVKHDDKGLAIVNIEKGCCRFVNNKGLADEE